jgi:hypothetical protein
MNTLHWSERMTEDYDVVLDTLQKHRDILWKMTERNMTSEHVQMNIMDDIRLKQIEQLDKAMTMWKKEIQPEQEPVAWQVKYLNDERIPQIAWFPHPVHPKSPLAKRPYTEEPLYYAPPKRCPKCT